MRDGGVSVVIPAFRAEEFIDECLSSIANQAFDNYEVLVGIDGCPITLQHIKKKAYAKNVRFFYFQHNEGPYVVKNSLIAECRNEYILFFDADDIMAPDVIAEFYKCIQKVDVVRLPYANFQHGKPRRTLRMGDDGIFGVRKDRFEEVNGFYNWMCSADTEFIKRVTAQGWKIMSLPKLALYRRIHKNNLTVKADTNFESKLRKKYDEMIKKGPLKNPVILVTQPHHHVENTNA